MKRGRLGAVRSHPDSLKMKSLEGGVPALRVGMQARLGVWVRRDLDGRGFTRLVAVVVPQGPVKDPLLVGPHRRVLEVTDGDHHVA